MWLSILLFILKIFAAFFICFLFWRRLKDDYPSFPLLWTYLLTLTGLILISFLGTFIQTKLPFLTPFPQELFFWLGGSAGFILSLRLFKKHKINSWEMADYLWLSLAGLIILTQLFQFTLQTLIGNLELFRLVFIGWWILVWGFSFWLSFAFRQLVWYKSGRVGLAALLGPATYFFGNSLLAFFLPPDLYWGQENIITQVFFLSLTLALIGIVVKHAEIKFNLLDITDKFRQIKTHGQNQKK